MKKTLYILLILFVPLFGFGQIKVSEMTSATTVNPSDYFLLIQSSSSKKVPYSVFKYTSTEAGLQISDSLLNYTTLSFLNDTLGEYLTATEVRSDISDSLSVFVPSAAGSNNQIQFNNSGTLGASSNFSFIEDTAFVFKDINENMRINGYKSTSKISGSNNVAFGLLAGELITTGNGNTIINDAGYSLTTGNNNVLLGLDAGASLVSGSGNVMIGPTSGFNETGSDKLYIDNSSTSNPVIYGEFNNKYVKINDSLEVSKALKFGESDAQAYVSGKVYYDTNYQALTFYNDLPNFSHELGYKHAARYYNNTGSTITKKTLLTPFGQKVNGVVLPTVKLAGNLSSDSLQMVGMSATNTPNGEFGVVTLLGPVSGLNTSAFNDNDFVYVGHNGTITNVNPNPPSLSLRIGKVFYADNDSGQIYMMQGEIGFNPNPLFALDTIDLNETVAISTQNVYEYIPISSIIVEDNNFGFTRDGDSIQVQTPGYYQIVLSMSFQGNPTSETWNYGICINETLEHKKTRTTSSSQAGDTNVPLSRQLSKDDWVSFKIRNTSGTGDPTIVDLAVQILFLHE